MNYGLKFFFVLSIITLASLVVIFIAIYQATHQKDIIPERFDLIVEAANCNWSEKVCKIDFSNVIEEDWEYLYVFNQTSIDLLNSEIGFDSKIEREWFEYLLVLVINNNEIIYKEYSDFYFSKINFDFNKFLKIDFNQPILSVEKQVYGSQEIRYLIKN